jgi:cell shape-determining protein MreD
MFKWIRQDGLLHIETSALLVVAISVLLPVWLSIVISFIFGIGKELWDKYHGGVSSWHDVICDIIGLAVGALITILIVR